MKHLAMTAAYSSVAAILIFPLWYRNQSHFNTRTVGAVKNKRRQTNSLQEGDHSSGMTGADRECPRGWKFTELNTEQQSSASFQSHISDAQLFSVPASRVLPCSHQQGQTLSPAPDPQHISEPFLVFPHTEKRRNYKRNITVRRVPISWEVEPSVSIALYSTGICRAHPV